MMTIDVSEFRLVVERIVGPGAFDRSALNIRNGAGVIESVLSTGRYRTVLEIGTYRGLTAAYMTQFCDRVTTIDLLEGWLELKGIPFDRRALWAQLGVLDKIDFRLVRDDAEKKEVIDSLNFDIAFIDGGKVDIADDFALVKRCGTVLFHDYDFTGRERKDRVYNFVNSLPSQHVKVMDIFALWTEAPQQGD